MNKRRMFEMVGSVLVACCLYSTGMAASLNFQNGLNGITVEGTGTVEAMPYALRLDDAMSVQLNYEGHSSDAGFNSLVGYYIANDQNEPIGGEVLWAKVKDFGSRQKTLQASDFMGGKKVATFVLPDGGRKNTWVNDGDVVSFTKEADGSYDIWVDGTRLNHADDGALFSDFNINLLNYPNMTDIPYDAPYYFGNMDWEDRTPSRSDFDFNDISLSFTALVEDPEGNFIAGTNWGDGVLTGSLLRKAKTGNYFGEAVSKQVLLDDGNMCWQMENAQGGLVGFARTDWTIPPEDITAYRDIHFGVYMTEDGSEAYVVEGGKVKYRFPLDTSTEKHFCIERSNEEITYTYNGSVFHTSFWPVPNGEPLFADVVLTIDESFIENLEGINFVDNSPDTDRDGIPDVWEIQHGYNPSNKVDAWEDGDDDGVVNWMEYEDGTSPTNALYMPEPQDFLWWLRGLEFSQGGVWTDLSQRGHDSVSDTSNIELHEELDGRKYAHLELTDEIRCSPGSEPWLQNNANDIADFTLMVVVRMEWAGSGYENLIDLTGGSESNGFRIGVNNGSWLLESGTDEGAFLEDFENTVKLGEDTVLVVRYDGDTGLAEIWIDGERHTWSSSALIRNITGEGYIHKLSGTPVTQVKESKLKLAIEAFLSVFNSSAYAVETTASTFALIQEVALWGRALSYAEIVALNASVGTVSEDEALQAWAASCGIDYAQNPNEDSDGDGVSNYEEALAGTDPNDSGSVFGLEIINRYNGEVDLYWPSPPNSYYVLDETDDLLDWSGLKEVKYGTGASEHLTIVPAGLTFWRLEMYPQLDSDGDGLSGWLEACIGTDPNVYDTDGDGVSDGAEIKVGTDPLIYDRPDTDRDGIDDRFEVLITSDSGDADTIYDIKPEDDYDGDCISNGNEFYAGLSPLYSEASNNVPYSAEFEMPTYTLGNLGSVDGWYAPASGPTVQNSQVANGSQAVQMAGIDSRAALPLCGVDETQVETRFSIRLSSSSFFPPPEPLVNQQASTILAYDPQEGLKAFDGKVNNWKLIPNTLLPNQWVSVVINQDYNTKTWSVTVNGAQNISDIGFKNTNTENLSMFQIRGSDGGEVYFDQLNIQ